MLPTISNVPKEVSFRGIVYPCTTTRAILENMKCLDVHQDDIFITGYMRSGNNLVQAITCAILNADSLETFQTDGMKNVLKYPLEYFSAKYLAKYVPRPNVFFTHVPLSLLPEDVRRKKVKVIHVIRNPNDVAVSAFHFHRINKALGAYTGTWDEFFRYFNSGNIIYGSWYNYTKEWINQSRDLNVKIVRYEDIVGDPHKAISGLAEFLGRLLTTDQLAEIARKTSFTRSKTNPMLNKENDPMLRTDISGFIRKGKVGDWKNYFTESQRRASDVKYKELVKETGLESHFESELSKRNSSRL